MMSATWWVMQKAMWKEIRWATSLENSSVMWKGPWLGTLSGFWWVMQTGILSETPSEIPWGSQMALAMVIMSVQPRASWWAMSTAMRSVIYWVTATVRPLVIV
jgi:hypothetical protein